ncbi:AraC family transcriptional regulator [Metasolibacillus meyeri]|uniref:AraC family transcriptional regulator n=1 Tax=Metasolibacillus meyeri TaxID=1071052 RepID=A0AAW9NSN7_9BACL|nr:AraC family transcriptional regulator [Metasolibacillus meyeri]MEC1179038.1 AraC family transcriptional regulator [Metasolibacillus meyeri]
MNISLNETIKYFARSTIQYSDLFVRALASGMVDRNRYTAPKVSGLVITLSGSATFSLNGVKYVLNKERILHAGPNMLIEITTNDTVAWEYVVIHYNMYVGKLGYENKHFMIETGEHNKIEYFVQQLIQQDQQPGDIANLKCQLLFYQLIETMLVCAKMQISNNFVDYALILLAENYAQPISIADIAEQIGCERRRFAYLFNKQVGMTPIQYLTEIRLKQAKKLLRTTKIPINEIAELVGYADSFYFCRVFKKQYHMTPTQFRNEI